MPVASFRFDESNGAGETITNGVSTFNYGSADGADLAVATNRITAGNNSFTKYWKLEITNMNGLNAVDNLAMYKSAGAYLTGEGIQTDLRTSSYAAPTYATPTASTYTDQTMPTSAPASANWGIATSLTGQLTAAGKSDYVKSQLQTTASTPPGSANQKTFTITWDES